MKSVYRFAVIWMVWVTLVVLTVHTRQVCGGEPAPKARAKLPLSRESVTGPTVQPLGKPIRWKDREYDVAAGIDVLMSVIRDPENNNERELGLVTLAMASRNMEGHQCMDELVKLYDDANDLDKGSILICFQGSEDPRGIPVYVRTLDNSQNLKLRLWAAGALAHWNVRRGVAELVDLLESKDPVPQPSRMFYVRDNALDAFHTQNRLKGWGFRQEEVQEWVKGKTDLDQDQMIALYIGQVRKWFAENEHRFPDWKPGDPLPEVALPK